MDESRRGAERPRGEPLVSRRAFVFGGLLGAAGAAGLTAVEAYQARYLNPYQPVLENIEIPVPASSPGLAGLRIGFLTDTHVGPFISGDDLKRATDLLHAERPDLLLMGGDFVSESRRYADPTAEVLHDLVSEAPFGAYAVLGNHDYAVSASRVRNALERARIDVLRNQATSIRYNGEDLWIGGIDETLMGNPDPPETFESVPEGAASIALWHEPQFAEMAAAWGPFLQLSGHTHGGQIRLPGVGPVGLPVHGKRYVIGLNEADGMAVYTSRGVGVYRPPMRFNCPPEVTVITLTAPREPGDDTRR